MIASQYKLGRQESGWAYRAGAVSRVGHHERFETPALVRQEALPGLVCLQVRFPCVVLYERDPLGKLPPSPGVRGSERQDACVFLRPSGFRV